MHHKQQIYYAKLRIGSLYTASTVSLRVKMSSFGDLALSSSRAWCPKTWVYTFQKQRQQNRRWVRGVLAHDLHRIAEVLVGGTAMTSLFGRGLSPLRHQGTVDDLNAGAIGCPKVGEPAQRHAM
ncbi:hypothetical protein [Streptomyces sp. 900105245]